MLISPECDEPSGLHGFETGLDRGMEENSIKDPDGFSSQGFTERKPGSTSVSEGHRLSTVITRDDRGWQIPTDLLGP